MRLFEKYNRLNITATILTFVIGSCTFYFLLYFILINQLDETLQTEEQEILSYVNIHNALPEIIKTKDQSTSYERTEDYSKSEFLSRNYKYGKEEQNLREIQFTVSVNKQFYLVKVDKPLEETEALLQVIIVVTIVMIAVILLIGYLVNRIMIRRLWKPFYRTIDHVKTYHLADQDTLNLENVDIDEFSLLNKSINEMTDVYKKTIPPCGILPARLLTKCKHPLQ